MKKRLREGAKLIVLDPRRTDIVRSPHIEAQYHLPLQPGTNVAVLTALAHVIVTEGLFDDAFVRERCDWAEFQDWAEFVALPREQPGSGRQLRRSGRGHSREAARLYATGGNAAIYYGLGVTEHSQGSTTVIGHRQSRDGDRQYRPPRRRRESPARPEQCAGRLRHGLVPA